MENSSTSSKLAYSYSNIEDILQCPLCLDRFHDPRALPCQHVFCCSCLKIIITSNKLCSMITCPLCRLIFPYNNNTEQFPVSYIHKQLLDLSPINCTINGKCSKCKSTHGLNLCPCCCYHLCKNCLKNDRENSLINLEDLIRQCSNLLSTKELDDLLNQANAIILNPQTIDFQDILILYYQLNSMYNQLNILPVTIPKRPCENDDDNENFPKSKLLRSESIDYSNKQVDDDDDDGDDIVYLETVQRNPELTLDG